MNTFNKKREWHKKYKKTTIIKTKEKGHHAFFFLYLVYIKNT
jgi:hypothetical protein